jgi:hypothetical protein
MLQPRQQAVLARLIQNQVIPRLLLSLSTTSVAVHSDATEIESSSQQESQQPTCARVAEFARILLHGDRIAAGSYVAGMRREGFSLGQVYLELLAPGARHLCELWEGGEYSFQEVSAALIRLLAVLRALKCQLD